MCPPLIWVIMFLRHEIVTSVARLSNLWLRFGAGKVRIKNHEILKDFLFNKNGPLLTVSNHISTVDDPVMWSALLDPKQIAYLIERDRMRWTVGAKELTFTNIFTGWFFSRGQVIPIIRGRGIYQAAMDEARDVLESGRWLHFFPEGRVIQYQARIDRLKWGVGRLLMECSKDVTVLPIMLKGFDCMKPNGRFPNFNCDLDLIVGNPVRSFELLENVKAISCLDERRSQITRFIQDVMNETLKMKNS